MQLYAMVVCLFVASTAAGCDLVASFAHGDAWLEDAQLDQRAPDLPIDTLPMTDTTIDGPRRDMFADARVNDLPSTTLEASLTDLQVPTTDGPASICQVPPARMQLGAGRLRALYYDVAADRAFVVGAQTTPKLAVAAAVSVCSASMTTIWGASLVSSPTVNSEGTDIVLCEKSGRLCVVGKGNPSAGSSQVNMFAARTTASPVSSQPVWIPAGSLAAVDGPLVAIGTQDHLLVGWANGPDVRARSYFTQGGAFGVYTPITSTPLGSTPRAAHSLRPGPSGFVLTYTDGVGELVVQPVPASCEVSPCSTPAATKYALPNSTPATAVTTRLDIVVAFGVNTTELQVGRYRPAQQPQTAAISKLSAFQPRRARFLDARTVAVVGTNIQGRPMAVLFDAASLAIERTFAGWTSPGTFYDVAQVGATLVFVGEMSGQMTVQRCPRASAGSCP